MALTHPYMLQNLGGESEWERTKLNGTHVVFGTRIDLGRMINSGAIKDRIVFNASK